MESYLPLHHSERGAARNRCQFGKLNFFFDMNFASKGNPQSENLAFRLPPSPFDEKMSEVFGTECRFGLIFSDAFSGFLQACYK